VSFLFWLIITLPLPLAHNSRLTSAFAENRITRFHMGVDFSTNHRDGIPVVAVEDGEVVRIKSSFFGLGKVLYVKGKSRNIYVYAHLERFRKDLERLVRSLQYKNKRFFLDHFPEQKPKVKKGKIIGYSGESGAGPPHLHFEIRRNMDIAFNPAFYFNVNHNLKFKGVRLLSPLGIFDLREEDTTKIPERFNILVKCSYFVHLKIIIDNDTVAVVELDSIPYSKNSLAQIFYLYEGGRYSDSYFRLTGYKDIIPPVVKKTIPEVKLATGVHRFTVIVMDLQGREYFFNYSVKVERKGLIPTIPKDPLFTEYGVIFPDGSIFNQKTGTKDDIYILKIEKDKSTELVLPGLKLKFSEGSFPWDFWIGVKWKGDTLTLFPAYPPLVKPIQLTSSLGEIYARNGNKVSFLGIKEAKLKTLGKIFYARDSLPPEVKLLHISQKKIIFSLKDNLSGILADSIKLYIDGRWVPAEYDIDNNILTYRVLFSDLDPQLYKGKHDINLKIMDRAYNKTIFHRTIWLK